jgi:hypothetical protein
MKIENYYTWRKRELSSFSRSRILGRYQKPFSILLEKGFIHIEDIDDIEITPKKDLCKLIKKGAYKQFTHIVYYSRIGGWGLPFIQVFGK